MSTGSRRGKPFRPGRRAAGPRPGAIARRAFLGVAGAALAEACARPARSIEAPAPVDPLARLEERVGGRIGVFALDGGGGAALEHRADERFALCSTFKWALAAAVLARVDRATLGLDQPIAYGEADLLAYAPVTAARVT